MNTPLGSRPDSHGRLLSEFERLIRRDPARRGLLASEADFEPLGVGEFHHASHSLRSATAVGLITGFYIPHADLPAAETDGPHGTALLARILRDLGADVVLFTDPLCESAVTVAAHDLGLTGIPVRVLTPDPDEAPATDAASDRPNTPLTPQIIDDLGRLSHLVSVERVGPSHTPGSASAQPLPQPSAHRPPPYEVPADAHDRCHNMRGKVIDAWSPPLYRLVEWFQEHRPQATTIGIGDGGNEIGMGKFHWADLARRLPGDHAARLPCRIATDWTIIAGTSNWGAMALAAAVATLAGRESLLSEYTMSREEQRLRTLVDTGPAVDGVTGRREATVDGLPIETYLQPWLEIRRQLDLD